MAGQSHLERCAVCDRSLNTLVHVQSRVPGIDYQFCSFAHRDLFDSKQRETPADLAGASWVFGQRCIP